MVWRRPTSRKTRITPKPRDYVKEDLLYREFHARGEVYYQHKPDELCAEDLAYLFSWEHFPGEGERLLELGCGDGFHTGILAGMGLNVTGVDCSPAAIARARHNLKAAGRQATLLVADACGLGVLGENFAPYILDSHCLHCVTDYEQRRAFLSQVRSVLQDGGRFFVATMGAQTMGWTQAREGGRWLDQFEPDERGCWVHSCLPPRCSRRVKLRIWVTEEILREELLTAGFKILRFETFTSPKDPLDKMLLAELKK